MPSGRIRKVLMALQRHVPDCLQGLPEAGISVGADAPPKDSSPERLLDPLRFYPIGANGRLRPPGEGNR